MRVEKGSDGKDDLDALSWKCFSGFGVTFME